MNSANGVYWLASVKNIKFEENELRRIYRELALKGINIVNVISYKCIRDLGGAPDIEYALFSLSSVLTVADEAKDIDLLKLQVEIAHEEDLLTRTYLNAHWYGYGFYSKHRD
ncbi:MAG: hypothetical protein DRN04_07230 [Thermoprotei archaeon]|nr:MAG: hypothetical protein DRN04_07230 [Thermoprotei archaeon]